LEVQHPKHVQVRLRLFNRLGLVTALITCLLNYPEASSRGLPLLEPWSTIPQ